MEIIYKKIADTFNSEAVKNVFNERSLPQIRQVDIYYGQPENMESFEIFMPAIFVNWSIQPADANSPNTLMLDFHVCQEPGIATENFSPVLDAGIEYLLVLKAVKYILNRLRATNTSALTYVGERPVTTPYLNYHIVTYQCFIDKVDESFTKGKLTTTELDGLIINNQNIKQKTISAPLPSIDVLK